MEFLDTTIFFSADISDNSDDFFLKNITTSINIFEESNSLLTCTNNIFLSKFNYKDSTINISLHRAIPIRFKDQIDLLSKTYEDILTNLLSDLKYMLLSESKIDVENINKLLDECDNEIYII